MVISVARRSLQQIRKDVTAILHRANPAESNECLMAIQARLCELLHARGANWEEPLWPDGPSPADLERQPWPRWASEVRLMIGELDGED